MNVTFMMGNGFDLACGLRTSYIDVYNAYACAASDNRNISSFKNGILRKERNRFALWSTFELALPEFAQEVGNFDVFIECKHDFTEFVKEYMFKEQERLFKISDEQELKRVFETCFFNIYDYCLHISHKALKEKFERQANNYNFITFNYTNTLERCLHLMPETIENKAGTACTITKPLHIHSTLHEGIVLGLDDEELYKNLPCDSLKKIQNSLDKVIVNSKYSDITEEAGKVISASDIIVIYGWSMGGSDRYWVKQVQAWFAGAKEREIIYVPYYPEPADLQHKNILPDREDESREHVRSVFDIPTTEEHRIHVVTDDRFMSLKKVIRSQQQPLDIESETTLAFQAKGHDIY